MQLSLFEMTLSEMTMFAEKISMTTADLDVSNVSFD
jgi:hypothetical protein